MLRSRVECNAASCTVIHPITGYSTSVFPVHPTQPASGSDTLTGNLSSRHCVTRSNSIFCGSSSVTWESTDPVPTRTRSQDSSVERRFHSCAVCLEQMSSTWVGSGYSLWAWDTSSPTARSAALRIAAVFSSNRLICSLYRFFDARLPEMYEEIIMTGLIRPKIRYVGFFNSSIMTAAINSGSRQLSHGIGAFSGLCGSLGSVNRRCWTTSRIFGGRANSQCPSDSSVSTGTDGARLWVTVTMQSGNDISMPSESCMGSIASRPSTYTPECSSRLRGLNSPSPSNHWPAQTCGNSLTPPLASMSSMKSGLDGLPSGFVSNPIDIVPAETS